MERIRVPLSGRSYDVTIAGSVLQPAAAALAGRRAFLITDTNVDKLYNEAFQSAFGSLPKYVIEAGEASKCLTVLERVLAAMLEAGLNRHSVVVALGGGVVGDLAGFAAAVYMRGIRLIQIPTTLLAQVDSSVGGKTAVDLNGVKNIVGAFHQPESVWIGTEFLNTLPPREVRCGWGEIVKTAFLNKPLYDRLRAGCTEFSEVIPACVRVKRDVVAADEREAGERKKLNLGHTFGHALETLDKRLSHGEYVLKGLELEFALSNALNLADAQYLREALSLIRAHLVEEVPLPEFDALYGVIAADKKNTDAGVSFVLPVRPGVTEERVLDREQLCAFWRRVCE